MWRSPPTAVDDIARQVVRVRRRRNAYAAQLALYGVLATAAAAAAIVVVLAVVAGARAFAVGAGAAIAAVGLAFAFVLRAAGRRWVRARRAAGWIDAEAELDGRLATLVEIDGRDGALVPLLVAQNVERLGLWQPERIVPSAVPLRALASALAAGASLVLALVVAPSLLPAAPEIVWSDRSVAPVDVAGEDGADETAARLAISPLAAGGANAAAGALPGAGATPRDRATRPAPPPTLRDRLRRRLWGERWTAAANGDVGAGTPRPNQRGDGGAASDGAPAAGGAPGGAGAHDAIDAATADGAPAQAAGAGDGTDPELFAVPAEDEAVADGRFALGLGARVHGPRGEPRPPSGDAPAADADARPLLAPGPREATLPRRGDVPAELEAVVRALFAHGEDIR
jgi:hypothetical protein